VADLEFGFEVEDKVAPTIAPKLEHMLAALNEIAAAVQKSDTVVKTHAKTHEASWEGIGHSIEGARNKMTEFLEVIGAVAAFEVLEKLIDKFAELGEEIVKSAAHEERLSLSFENLFGGNKEGAEEFIGWLDRIAKHTEFTAGQLKTYGAELLKAGIKPEQADKFVAAGLDIAAKSANPQEAMASAMAAFERASLTGRVSARQLIGLGVGVEDLKTLPQFAHMDDDQIRKSLQKGTIGLNDFLTVIAGADGMLGDMGVKASATMEAQITHFKNLPDLFFERLSQSEGFESLKTTFGGILDELDPDSPRGQRIFSSLEIAFNSIATFAEKADLPDLIEAVATSVDDLFENLLRIFSLLPGSMGEAARAAADQMALSRGLSESGLDKFESHWKARPKAIEGIGLPVEDADQADDAAMESLLRGGSHGEHGAEAAGHKIGAAFGKGHEKGTRAALGTHSPSTVFADIGEDVADGFAIGMARGGGARGPEIRIPAPGGGGNAPITVDVGGVHVHSTGDAHADVEAIAANLEPAMIRMLERLRARQGA
jgi:hypothetical protein